MVGHRHMEEKSGIILLMSGLRVKRLTIAGLYYSVGLKISISEEELTLEGASDPTFLISEHGLQSLTPDRIIVRLKVETVNCQL